MSKTESHDQNRFRQIEAEVEAISQTDLSSIVINSLPGVFYLFNENGKFLQWNKNFEAVTGFSKEEVSKMTPLDFFEGSDRELIFGVISKVFVEGKGDAIADFTTKDKAKVPYHFNGRLIGYDGTRCLIGMGIDTTKLKEYEKEQEGLLNRLEKISNNVPGFLYEFRMRKDGTTHFPFSSKGINQIFGLTPEDIKSDSAALFSRIHPDDIERIRNEVQRSAQELAPQDVEFRVKSLTGQTKWVRTNSTIESQADGSLLWYGHTEDITSRKLMERANIRQQNFLKAINEIQSQFILEKDSPRFFDFTLTKILEITNSEFGFIGEVLNDKDGEYVKTLAISNIAWDEDTRDYYAKNSPVGMEFRNPKTLFGEIINSKKHVISNDSQHDSRRGGQPSGHPPMDTFLGVPLMVGDKVIGMFGIANGPGGYNEEAVDFLKPLTTVITNILNVVRSDRDRKQAEMRLERTSKRLELATKSAGLGIWQIDFVNNVWEPDERLREILGIQETKLTHESYLALMHPEDQERKKARDKEKLEHKGTQYYDEYKIIRPIDGEMRYLKSRGVFFRDENGKPIGGISVVYDQTKEKQDTLSLQQAKERLERVITSIREGIWERDLETNTFHFSSRWKEMYGYTDEDLVDFDKNWPTFIHPDDILLVSKRFDKGLKGPHSTFDVEFRTKHKDGHHSWSRMRCLVTYNASGKPIKLTGSNEDITERKSMEQNLAEGESHLRTILHAEPECVKLLDRNCNLLDMNPAGLAMIEADNLEMVKGACVIDLIKPDYRDAFVELNKGAFKGKSGSLTFEVVGLRGTSRWLESNVVPLIDGTGNITAALGVTKDVTEQKLYEAELINNNKEKDFLIKEIHHRVKNNLQLISSMLYLKMLEWSNPESREFMKGIREKIKSVALIHERLLQTESLNSIEIKEYLQKLLHDIQVTYYRQDLKLSIRTDIEELAFSTDTATSLGQLVNELVINAIKHAFVKTHSGEISVSLNKHEEGFELNVCDNGVGLNDIDPLTAKTYGMQLVQVFVKQLKGRMEVSQNRGTRYSIYFKN